MSAPREVVVLGSTGSIGTQALDVVARNPDRFRVVGVAAGGSPGSVGTLARQALDHRVEAVAVARASAAGELQAALEAAAGDRPVPKVLAGEIGRAHV